MSTDKGPSDVRATAPGDCPLSSRAQTRNLVLYGINVGLVYLAAPALYVGMVQAALLEKLGASNLVANLPASLYFWMTPLPIVVAWYFCTVRLLRPVLIVAYLIVAAAGAGVMATLLISRPTALPEVGQTMFFLQMPAASQLVILAVLVHGAAMGCTLGVVANFQWEVLGRGVAESRRGQALALAFGAGPVLAFLASLGSQWLLDGLAYPWNFAALFGVSVPAMVLAAILSTLFVVPPPAVEIQRQPFLEGVFGGIGEFIRYRVTLRAGIATFLVGCGYNIITNFTLFTKEAIGEQAEQSVGYQNAMRFGFKVVAGLFLGWLLTRAHPRAGLLVTGGLCLASVAWILMAPALFLFSFGLMGAGELWGVYYPNYILSASAKSRMRRNMAITSLIYMPTGFVALLYGFVADTIDLRASFFVSIGLLAVTLLFVQIFLPARPHPPADQDQGGEGARTVVGSA